MSSMNSLYVIDDDEMYRYIAEQTLASAGFTGNITTFSNGSEAIAAMESELSADEKLPDLILLDLNMPVLDGWGFLEDYSQLKSKISKHIPIYIVSSSFNPVDVERANQINEVSGYVVKPITKQKFRELIQQG